MAGPKGGAAGEKTAGTRSRPGARAARASAAPVILVADDEPSMLRLAVMLLKDFLPRALVRTVADGYEAARVLRAMKPDLLITDLFMPGPDGVQLSAMARLNPRLEELKILAMTGRDSPETRKDALRSGANEYLAKPFDPEEFRSAVLRLLGIEDKPAPRGRRRAELKPPQDLGEPEEDEEEPVEHVAELGEPEPLPPPFEQEEDDY